MALLPILIQLLQLFMNRRRLRPAQRVRLRGIVAKIKEHKAVGPEEQADLAEAKALADELAELLDKAERGE